MKSNLYHNLTQLIPIPLSSLAKSNISNTKNSLSIQHLLSCNLHLGHSTDVVNKNMIPFIYGKRDGIHVVNLDETLFALKKAMNVTREIALRGGNILFVGSKPLLHKVVVEAAREGKGYFATKWFDFCI